MAKTDYNLLFLLSENARIRLKDLSTYLKKSQQSLNYSVSILEKDSIISNPYCIFDYSYFGVLLFRTYFKGGYINEQDKLNIINELKDNPYIVSIYELTGEFDLVIEFASPNPSKFNKELKKIATLNPTLNDYKIIVNIVSYICPRNYLTKNSSFRTFYVEKIIGGDRERDFFNPNEMMVIKSLLSKPTGKLTELAAESRLNIKTVRTILKDISKRNVIKGFKYILNTEKLSLHCSRLFLKLANVNLERELQLIRYLLTFHELVQINKTVGDWDLELDIETTDSSKTRSIIMQIREDFKDIIKHFNIIEFYKYYKKSYLPEYLFAK